MNPYTELDQLRAWYHDNSESCSHAELNECREQIASVLAQIRIEQQAKPWWRRIRIPWLGTLASLTLIGSAIAGTYVYDLSGNQIGYSPLPPGTTVIVVAPWWTKATPIPQPTPVPAYVPFRYSRIAI